MANRMKISSATIDCWLYAFGHGSGGLTDRYFDYQHHRWELQPSSEITTAIQKFDYTWTLDGHGYDHDGSWTTSNGMTTNPTQAQVWINSSGVVILEQAVGYGTNTAPAVDNTGQTTHPIPEFSWPALTWDPSLHTPTSIAFRDGTPPSAIVWKVLIDGHWVTEVQHRPGVGGEDYSSNGSQFYQRPAASKATGWWNWTINLVH